MEKNFSMSVTSDPMVLLLSFGIVLLASVLSVIYPSLFLSNLKVTKVFKGGLEIQNKRLLTKSMVTLQFLVSIVFLIVTVALNKQHNYLMYKDKGYDDSNLLKVTVPYSEPRNKSEVFRNKLQSIPAITSIGGVGELNEAIRVNNREGESKMLILANADPDYIETMGITLAEGRNFLSADVAKPSEENPGIAAIMNKTAVDELGIENPLGKTISDGQYRIVGVIEDYQIFSATARMNSILLTAESVNGRNYRTNNVYIRYEEGQLAKVVEGIEEAWKEVLPFTPFSVTYVDAYNEGLYKKEALWSKTLNYASSVSIFVSFIGLLGLVSFSAQQRRKELSIRKVLGASLIKQVTLLNQGFVVLLCIAIVISIPISHYIIQDILEGYHNRIDITTSLFAIPSLIFFILGSCTVSSITVNNARRNPIEDLRNE